MFTVYSENDRGSTLISNLFIDQYMKDANDAQLKVYLYLLRMMNAGRPTSISDMADQFNHTEKEVLRSLRYWESRGLIAFEYGNSGELLSLHMLTPRVDTPAYPAVRRERWRSPSLRCPPCPGFSLWLSLRSTLLQKKRRLMSLPPVSGRPRL